MLSLHVYESACQSFFLASDAFRVHLNPGVEEICIVSVDREAWCRGTQKVVATGPMASRRRHVPYASDQAPWSCHPRFPATDHHGSISHRGAQEGPTWHDLRTLKKLICWQSSLGHRDLYLGCTVRKSRATNQTRTHIARVAATMPSTTPVSPVFLRSFRGASGG